MRELKGRKGLYINKKKGNRKWKDDRQIGEKKKELI